jgi:ceramide glucosyltransferase
MAFLKPLLLLLLLLAAGYQVAACLLVWRFLRESTDPPAEGDWPGLSQIKPVSGREPELEACLASFLDQDYPGPWEVLFCGSGLPAARRAAARFPGVPVRFVDEQGPGTNRKMASAAPAQGLCAHEILVLSDADMRASRDYLRRVAAGFRDPAVGVVTALYVVRRARGPGAALEGLSVADFAASVLVAREVEGLSFALGATMAVRRRTLADIGGLAALRDHLADDYQLGYRARRAGWKVALAGTVLEDVVGQVSLGEYLSHQLRWMRTYRLCRPAGHVQYLVTQGLLWALLLWATGGSGAWLGLWLALRAATCSASWFMLARSPVAAWALLTPLKDLVYLALWVLSLTGSTVRWGEQVYRVHPDGRMEEVASSLRR